jgi:hypothetical protein
VRGEAGRGLAPLRRRDGWKGRSESKGDMLNASVSRTARTSRVSASGGATQDDGGAGGGEIGSQVEFLWVTWRAHLCSRSTRMGEASPATGHGRGSRRCARPRIERGRKHIGRACRRPSRGEGFCVFSGVIFWKGFWISLGLEVNTIFATVCHVSAILLLIGSLDFPSWKPDSLSANPVAPEPNCDKPPPFAPRGFP